MAEGQKTIAWPVADDALYAQVQQACTEQGEREHRRVSVSEWLREAARLRLCKRPPST